jgi:AcrR family transcriptional regulator
MREAAARLVNEQGFAALNFRTLAEALRLTRTAPLYYFGTTAGLIAAVAGQGFDDLAERLRRLRDSSEPSEQLLRDFALAYAEFALRRPHLYRAMHAPELWQVESDQTEQLSRASETGLEKARTWIQHANGARQAAFKEFELAVETTQAAGCVRADPLEQTGASVHLLTAIVDGFLFHHFAGHLGGGNAIGRLLTRLEGLVDRALSGLEVSQSDPGPDWESQWERVAGGTSVKKPRAGELRYHDALGPVIVVRPRPDGRLGVRKVDDEKEHAVQPATLLEVRPHPQASAKPGRGEVSRGRQKWKARALAEDARITRELAAAAVGGVVELGGGWQIVKRGEGSYMARRAGELTFAE